MTVPELLPGQSGLPVPKPTESYWLREPSEELLGHRSTRDLPAITDVVIIGSGITGAFAAHFLFEKWLAEEETAQQGAAGGDSRDVVMLEAREACSGATGRNGGHCQPNIYASAPEQSRFELAVYDFLRNFVASHSVPCDWVSLPHGGVHALMTDDLVEAARKHLDALAGTDPDLARCARLITPAGNGGDDGSKSVDEGESEGERKETLASLRVPGARAAVVQRHAASLWPYKLVAWVLENLLRRFPVTPPSTTTSNPSHSGAAPERRRPTFNLQTNTAALSLQRLDDGHGTPASSGATSARWIVHTSRGQIAARRAVLLATNGYTSHLLPGFRDLIVPVRGQMSALLPPELSSQPPQMRMEEGVVKDKADEEKRLVLKSSYVFFAHGNAKRGTRSQDDYLVQRPVVVGGSGNEATAKGGTGGELMFGGGRAQSAGAGFGEWDDSSIDSDVALYLRRELCQVLDMRPGAVAVSDSDTPMPQALPTTTRHGDCTDELRAVAEWTGIMGYSVDGSPWVGPVPDALGSTSTTTHLGASTYRTETDGGDPLPGLYVCAGYTGHGMPNAALCARAVALMVAGDVTRLVGGNDDDKAGTLLSLARDVGLPDEHLLTADRVRRARSGQIELDLWSCKEALVPSGGPPGLELCGLCKAERKNLD